MADVIQYHYSNIEFHLIHYIYECTVVWEIDVLRGDNIQFIESP